LGEGQAGQIEHCDLARGQRQVRHLTEVQDVKRLNHDAEFIAIPQAEELAEAYVLRCNVIAEIVMRG
jgi:hypothetical protein